MFYLRHESEIDGMRIEEAELRLQALAAEFFQDAIAFTHHIDSRLVYPRQSAEMTGRW